MLRKVGDARHERERAQRIRDQELGLPAALEVSKSAPVSSTFDAFQRLAAGLEGRKIGDKIADPNRPTWEQYKKDNEEKLDLVGKDMRSMIEYRAELDRERERRLNAAASSSSGAKKTNAIASSDESDDSDDDSDSDSGDGKKKHSKKRSKKHSKKDGKKKRKKGSSEDGDSDSEDGHDKRKKHKKHKKHKHKDHKKEDVEAPDEEDGPVRLSDFIYGGGHGDSD
jgi:hypothetical protein